MTTCLQIQPGILLQNTVKLRPCIVCLKNETWGVTSTYSTGMSAFACSCISWPDYLKIALMVVLCSQQAQWRLATAVRTMSDNKVEVSACILLEGLPLALSLKVLLFC